MNNSPIHSPGASGLAYELKDSGDDADLEEEESTFREGDSPFMKSELDLPMNENEIIASTSTLSPLSNFDDDTIIASQTHGNGLSRFDHLKPTILPNIRLSSPFASYTPPQGGSESEDELEKDGNGNSGAGGDEAEKVRKKGKGKVKEIDLFVEEEGDDRLYCICRQLYDTEVS